MPLRGHISDVDFPKKYHPWIGTDLRKLTVAEIDYLEKEVAIISALKKTAKDAMLIINICIITRSKDIRKIKCSKNGKMH